MSYKPLQCDNIAMGPLARSGALVAQPLHGPRWEYGIHSSAGGGRYRFTQRSELYDKYLQSSLWVQSDEQNGGEVEAGQPVQRPLQ